MTLVGKRAEIINYLGGEVEFIEFINENKTKGVILKDIAELISKEIEKKTGGVYSVSQGTVSNTLSELGYKLNNATKQYVKPMEIQERKLDEIDRLRAQDAQSYTVTKTYRFKPEIINDVEKILKAQYPNLKSYQAINLILKEYKEKYMPKENIQDEK